MGILANAKPVGFYSYPFNQVTDGRLQPHGCNVVLESWSRSMPHDECNVDVSRVRVERKAEQPAMVAFQPSIWCRGQEHLFPSSSAEAEFDALTRRHIPEQMVMDGAEFLRLGKLVLQPLLEFTRARVESAWTLEEVANSRPSSKKRRYLDAMGEPLDLQGRVSAFIKREKLSQVKVLDERKPYRLIQYRNTRYTMELQKYLLPIEHALYRYKHRGRRVFAKGRDLYGRAQDLLDLPGPIWGLLDHSRFDSLLQSAHLELEHWFYTQIFPSMAPLLRCQMVNVGKTRSGIRYSCTGRRMSGDANTALGNSLINYAILRIVMGEEAMIYLDGDDSVVSLSTVPDETQMSRFGEFGFKTTSKFVKDFNEVEFCQASVVQTVHGPLLTREPLRAMARMGLMLGVSNAKEMRTRMGQVVLCESICSAGVPILGALSAVVNVQRINSAVIDKDFYARGGHVYRHQKKCGTVISTEARIHFAEVFGIPPAMQVLLEKDLIDKLKLVVG